MRKLKSLIPCFFHMPGPEISAGHRTTTGDKSLLTGKGHSKVGQLDRR